LPGGAGATSAEAYQTALNVSRPEIQRRLNERGFKTDGIDGRTGSDTVKAIGAFQKSVGMQPVDGYAGLKVLARLRQAS